MIFIDGDKLLAISQNSKLVFMAVHALIFIFTNFIYFPLKEEKLIH